MEILTQAEHHEIIAIRSEAQRRHQKTYELNVAIQKEKNTQREDMRKTIAELELMLMENKCRFSYKLVFMEMMTLTSNYLLIC